MIIKCKMCGGDLELIPDATVAECPYCGTKQTIPTPDNEKKMTLFARANRLRFNCEFDKAASVYEMIVGEFPEEPEAYWGLVLCKYGIEYVDDPATGKKIPTCHRSSFDSVMEDENLELAMEYADVVAKRIYREEAKQIEEIRKGIVEVSAKEAPYDVFICYKETDENGNRTLDSVLAQDIYNELVDRGYRVFFSRITLEDKLGQEYEPYIFAALHSARVMVAVGTCYEYYDAVWVKNEWSRYLQLMAAGEKKTLIPCYKNLDAYDMPKEFAKLQAQDMGKVGAMQDLMRGLEKILGKIGGQGASSVNTAAVSGMVVLNAQTEALLKRGKMALEDGEFEKATEFFEQVLNNDAECGQAYFGKVLAAKKVYDSESLIQRLRQQVIAYANRTKIIIRPGFDLVKLAREADTETGMLTDFSDSQLKNLMLCKFEEVEPIYYKDYPLYFEAISAESKGQDLLHSLINNVDFKYAEKYADAAIGETIRAMQKELNEDAAREKLFFVLREIEQIKQKDDILEKLTGLLKRAEDNIENWKAKEEDEKRKEVELAEKKAEEDYQTAMRNYEDDYAKLVGEWEKAKILYQEECGVVAKKQSALQDRIANLEQEKALLKGFFTGKKRKELESDIAVLKADLAAMEFPQEPGEPPARDNIPLRENFCPKVIHPQSQIKSRIEAEVFLQDILKNLMKASVGEKVYLGTYPYDKAGNIQRIQWRVLEKKENTLLLLTEYGVDTKEYNDKHEKTSWENCTLRRWLNKDFLEKAFSDFEKKLIQTTSDTGDKIFLLSNEEAFENYFSDDDSRCCIRTNYALAQGAWRYNGEKCRWWLRSPGRTQEYAMEVSANGIRDDRGVSDAYTCVRPALWINLDSAID